MKNEIKLINKDDLKESNKQFEKIVRVSLLSGIIVISGLIVFYALTPEPGYVNFGILNSEKKAEDYPTSVRVGETIEFYVSVENYLNREFTFRIKILRGDGQSEVSSTGSDGAVLKKTIDNITLENAEEWCSKIQKISFSRAGKDQKIIAELWEITETNEEKFFNIVYLRLTVK